MLVRCTNISTLIIIINYLAINKLYLVCLPLNNFFVSNKVFKLITLKILKYNIIVKLMTGFDTPTFYTLLLLAWIINQAIYRKNQYKSVNIYQKFSTLVSSMKNK